MSFPTCTVKIPLWPPASRTRSGIFFDLLLRQSIEKIAYAISRLGPSGVSICISIQAAAGRQLPAPDVMESMASVIHEVDFAQIASMTSLSWQPPQRWECFSEGHLQALKSARKQMQVLCISDALTFHYSQIALPPESIALVASFRQLKKLVLRTKSASPDLSSLTHLTCLEDVSLMVSGHGNCAELIHNQRHKLMHIRLSAKSWEMATYQALSKVTALQTLVINDFCLTTSSADIIASLQRPHSIHVVLRKGFDSQRRILQILSSSSKVTDLTLKDCTPSMMEGLNTMRHLASLSIALLNIQNTKLQFQPGVTSLTLWNRGPIDEVSISRILTVLPALESLSVEGEDFSDNLYTFSSIHSLTAITQARLLSFLGLEAVRGVSYEDISMLEVVFRAQQKACLAPPRIHVILPATIWSSVGIQEFFIDYTKRPVFRDWRFAERKPTAAHQFMGKVGKSVRSWVQQKALACAGACKQFVPQDSMGYLVVAGVHTFCITHVPQ